MLKNKIIDVIIPVYNRENYIANTITSVLNQTYKYVNIILVDDGSTDASRDIINELSKKHENIHLICKENNSGISDTSNVGLNHSKADYIAFLDSDDKWDKDKLFKQIQYIETNKLDVCFTLVQEFNDNSSHARKEIFNGYAKSAMLCHSKVFKEIGVFDKDLIVGEFIDLISRCRVKNISFGMIEEILTYRRVHESNYTKQIKASDYLSVIRAHMNRKSKNDN